MPRGYQWTDQEIFALKENYLDKSLEEIAANMNRSEGGIASRLLLLAKNEPEEWDIRIVRTLYGKHQRKLRNTNPEKYDPSIKWMDEEVSKLKKNYIDKSIEELETIIRRGKWGIIQKLQKLTKEKPIEWDKERINCLYTELHREYMKSHPEQNYKKYEKKRIYKQFLKRGIIWNERDIIILANTYFTHNWLELTKIFCLKDIGVHEILKKLYKQDPSGWDIERIEELENESKRYSIEEIKKVCGHCASLKYRKTSPRRPEIDTLIEEGLNMRQAGRVLDISHQAIHQYITSRGLKEWYKIIQKNKN